MRPILITAGATHNPIDVMRSITSHASGKTGVEIALSLQKTHLLGSPLAVEHLKRRSSTEQHLQPSYASFGSTRNLQELMHNWIKQNPNGIVVHSAAVGDYECEQVSSEKISSQQAEILLRLIPAPKILNDLHALSSNLTIVSFKAAGPQVSDKDLLHIAQKQQALSHSTMVFANRLGSIDKNIMLVLQDRHKHYANRSDGIQALIDLLKAWQKEPS